MKAELDPHGSCGRFVLERDRPSVTIQRGTNRSPEWQMFGQFGKTAPQAGRRPRRASRERRPLIPAYPLLAAI